MTLYKLTAELQNFDFVIDEGTGEILNMDELDQLELERETKIENIGLWIKNLTSEAEAIKSERDNLQKREQAAKNKAERLKQYLQENLHGEKFKTARLEISYRKSESVSIEDMSKIPVDYLKVKYDPDKTAIKKAIKDGAEIPGAEIVVKENMSIK